MEIEKGFYWIEFKDDGYITVGELRETGDRWLNVMATDESFELEEVNVLGKIDCPYL